jgi:hypothetical protein
MTQNIKPTDNTTKPGAKRPNETGTVRVEGFVKIFDPKTQQVFVEKRA